MDDPAYTAFFHEAYDACHRAVFAYLLARVGNRETAKDLMQETFLRAWNQIHVGYEIGRDKCRFWIFRITKNLVADYYRRRAVRDQAESRMRQEALLQGASGPSPEEAYELKSSVRHIDEAVGRLPDDLRSVLLLHLVGQLNSAEIGELLDIPAGTVRYRISLARKRVRQHLASLEQRKEGESFESFGMEG